MKNNKLMTVILFLSIFAFFGRNHAQDFNVQGNSEVVEDCDTKAYSTTFKSEILKKRPADIYTLYGCVTFNQPVLPCPGGRGWIEIGVMFGDLRPVIEYDYASEWQPRSKFCRVFNPCAVAWSLEYAYTPEVRLIGMGTVEGFKGTTTRELEFSVSLHAALYFAVEDTDIILRNSMYLYHIVMCGFPKCGFADGGGEVIGTTYHFTLEDGKRTRTQCEEGSGELKENMLSITIISCEGGAKFCPETIKPIVDRRLEHLRRSLSTGDTPNGARLVYQAIAKLTL